MTVKFALTDDSVRAFFYPKKQERKGYEMSKELAELLFPEVNRTRTDLELAYPKRSLPLGAKVTRIAPSQQALSILVISISSDQ